MNVPYSHLLDAYKNLQHYGQVDSADFVSNVHNPSCGDVLVFYGIIENNSFKQLCFTGQGCIISQVSASILANTLLNKPIQGIYSIHDSDVSTLLKVDLGLLRLNCATLALEALRQGVQSYLDQKKESCNVGSDKSYTSTQSSTP